MMEPSMPIQLPVLPYRRSALEPHISAETLDVHYGKHHKAYVDKTNALIAGTDLDQHSLEDIIVRSASGKAGTVLFNNAAQAWNHAFYWQSMSPQGGGAPRGLIADRINGAFHGYDQFAEQFRSTAVAFFGSGWIWLLMDGGNRLRIATTSNADTPIAHRQTPLLTFDLWEHAYYLDYQNRRAEYVMRYLDKLVSWDFANHNLLLAAGEKSAAE
jgi:Fe-Mn family superoxide dismutase